MKSRRIRLVENTVERTARMLSQEYGIRVVWKGTQAMTDGKTICLPVLPDNAPDELLEAVQGYLDHETAHIIFTDFSALSKHTPELTPEQGFCVNSVEDVRIEEAMGNLFPGSPYNLRQVHNWVAGRLAENWGEMNQYRRACAAYFYYAKFGENEKFYQDVVDAATKELVVKCVTAIGSYDNINSTTDAIAAGLRMYDVLKQEAQEEEEQRKEREQEAAAQAGKKPGQQRMGGIGNGQSEPYDGELTSFADLGAQITHEVVDFIKSAGAKMSGGYSYKHNQEELGYLVYSTAEDTVKSFPERSQVSAGDTLMRMRDESREMTSVVKAKLVNALRSSSRRRWLGSKEEGKIDSRRLHHAVTGTADNIYKQLSEKVSLNTAVVMAIDHSGSMDGYKLLLASKAAIVLGDALNAVRIPFAVYGYSTERAMMTPVNSDIYARWNSLWIRYYRDFHEAWNTGALRLTHAQNNCKENTLDAESVKHGIRRLLQRPEKRKILLVLNDGMPYPGYGHVGRCQQHLHDVVNAAKDMGVEVVAIGIEDDDVKNYYPNHVVIRKLQDLVAEPLLLLDKMLRSKIRTR